MPVEIITHLDDPRLEPYCNLKATNLTRWSNQFVAEGALVVERLLASRFKVALRPVKPDALSGRPRPTSHPRAPFTCSNTRSPNSS